MFWFLSPLLTLFCELCDGVCLVAAISARSGLSRSGGGGGACPTPPDGGGGGRGFSPFRGIGGFPRADSRQELATSAIPDDVGTERHDRSASVGRRGSRGARTPPPRTRALLLPGGVGPRHRGDRSSPRHTLASTGDLSVSGPDTRTWPGRDREVPGSQPGHDRPRGVAAGWRGATTPWWGTTRRCRAPAALTRPVDRRTRRRPPTGEVYGMPRGGGAGCGTTPPAPARGDAARTPGLLGCHVVCAGVSCNPF